ECESMISRIKSEIPQCTVDSKSKARTWIIQFVFDDACDLSTREERVEAFEFAKGLATEVIDMYVPSTGTCEHCEIDFHLFNQLPLGQPLACAPKLCQSCADNEEFRIKSERDVKRFIEQNPGAKSYLSNSGNPPNPEAFNEVMAFCPYESGQSGIVAF